MLWELTQQLMASAPERPPQADLPPGPFVWPGPQHLFSLSLLSYSRPRLQGGETEPAQHAPAVCRGACTPPAHTLAHPQSEAHTLTHAHTDCRQERSLLPVHTCTLAHAHTHPYSRMHAHSNANSLTHMPTSSWVHTGTRARVRDALTPAHGSHATCCFALVSTRLLSLLSHKGELGHSERPRGCRPVLLCLGLSSVISLVGSRESRVRRTGKAERGHAFPLPHRLTGLSQICKSAQSCIPWLWWAGRAGRVAKSPMA